MLAAMGLLADNATIKADRLQFAGQDLLNLSKRQRSELNGKAMSMIFQEPMTSLNPCFTVGYQIIETLACHHQGSRSAHKQRAVELLQQVGIPDPERRMDAFPHQLSGGMSQRVMIAIAIACQPQLLIADEPTTALDVTIQAQILELLLKLQQEQDMALILITHDMGVVAETAQRVNVMYAGQLVEENSVGELFGHPQHPYTNALLAALPERGQGLNRLPAIPGTVPGQFDRIQGCLFHPRCPYAQADCIEQQPPLGGEPGRRVRCYYPVNKAHHD
jgi:dipeptide transport system ATP-binding protein